MALLSTIIVVSLVGSFICSMCEASLYAVTPTRVQAMCQAGVVGSQKLSKLRGRMDESIAAILTVNSITQTVGAAWAGALVAETYGNRWLGVFAGVFAVTMLMLTEIFPKSLGVAWASAVSTRVAWLIQVMIWIAWPLVKVCTVLTRWVTRHAPGQQPTEDELLVMADMAAEEGAILPEEQRWVRNVLRLNNVTAREIMTPQSAVHSLPADLPLNPTQVRAEEWIHSRLPVTESGRPDRVIGLVQRRIVFDHLMRGEQSKSLRDLMRPALCVPDSLLGHRLLDRFISERQHLAIVTDSVGAMIGVVSLEDVLEYLLGRPIVGEHDAHPKMQQLARERSRFHAADDINHGSDSPSTN